MDIRAIRKYVPKFVISTSGNAASACFRFAWINKSDALVQLCHQGYHYACFNAGKTLENSGDLAKSREVLSRGCALVDGESCGYLGYLSSKEKDEKTAASFYRKSCDFGSAYGCRNL